MNYETAQQLKDAGFPQEIVDGSFYWAGQVTISKFCWGGEGEDKPYGDYTKIPALSELIEGCQPYFSMLVSVPTVRRGGEIIQQGQWEAHASLENVSAVGESAKEAVAKLWLSLQSK